LKTLYILVLFIVLSSCGNSPSISSSQKDLELNEKESNIKQRELDLKAKEVAFDSLQKSEISKATNNISYNNDNKTLSKNNQKTYDKINSTLSDSTLNVTNNITESITDKTIYTGPRGGRYHYSKSGKKVYEKK